MIDNHIYPSVAEAMDEVFSRNCKDSGTGPNLRYALGSTWYATASHDRKADMHDFWIKCFERQLRCSRYWRCGLLWDDVPITPDGRLIDPKTGRTMQTGGLPACPYILEEMWGLGRTYLSPGDDLDVQTLAHEANEGTVR